MHKNTLKNLRKFVGYKSYFKAAIKFPMFEINKWEYFVFLISVILKLMKMNWLYKNVFVESGSYKLALNSCAATFFAAPAVLTGIAIYGVCDYFFDIGGSIDKNVGRNSELWK